MAAPSFQTGRPPPAAVEVLRVVERALKESRAVETESLCIVAGEKVWAVRVDVTVLDHCGNLADAVALAALASLLHFRKPHVEVIGSEVTIHTLQSHTPDALSVHHRPVCVSFAFVEDGSEAAAVDPSLVEEEVAVGSLTLALNVHRELCAVRLSSLCVCVCVCVCVSTRNILFLVRSQKNSSRRRCNRRCSTTWLCAPLCGHNAVPIERLSHASRVSRRLTHHMSVSKRLRCTNWVVPPLRQPVS